MPYSLYDSEQIALLNPYIVATYADIKQQQTHKRMNRQFTQHNYTN